jgi:peptidoglycan/xylan/chitin deacetylase (PgdA/CDA1 family)
LWRPSLYIDPQELRQRLEILKSGKFSVLPLSDALDKLRAGSLPPRSVALTFDDGGYDFFRQAYPLLREYGFPATVYQTTYYASAGCAVFNLICSYMLWTRRGQLVPGGEAVGLPSPLDLRTASSRSAVMRGLIEISERENQDALQKDEIAARLAACLKIDYSSLREKRLLQLMNGSELREIARNGMSVQLHTHRHRVPEDEGLFRKEIQENRACIQQMTGTEPVHFCYPSGLYRPAFLPWLRKENVVSATTCDAGLAGRRSESLLLPRFIDSQNRTQVEFESWITGAGDWLAVRRKAVNAYAPGRS